MFGRSSEQDSACFTDIDGRVCFGTNSTPFHIACYFSCSSSLPSQQVIHSSLTQPSLKNNDNYMVYEHYEKKVSSRKVPSLTNVKKSVNDINEQPLMKAVSVFEANF